MRIRNLMIGAASLTLMAGAAMAQSTQQVDPPQSPMAPPNSMQATPATTDQGATTTTVIVPAPDSTSMAPMDNSTMAPPTTLTPSRMYTNASGMNVQVVTNGPVPDTAANRAKYGKPMSHAGKRSAPAGN